MLETAIVERPAEEMSDAEILALSKIQISRGLQEIFSELLDKNREGKLTDDEVSQLVELGELCEQKLLQKAEALRIAVTRGLREPLSF